LLGLATTKRAKHESEIGEPVNPWRSANICDICNPVSDRLSNDLASLRIDRDPPPPGRAGLRRVLVFAALAGVAAAAWFAGKPWIEARVFMLEVTTTQVALVSPAQASVQLTATGYVVPQRIARVSAEVAGRIVDMRVDVGDHVAAGALLFTLDDVELRRGVATARARVEAALARARSARAEAAEVEQQATRQRALAAQGVAPAAEAEDLEARRAALAERMGVADAEVHVAQAEVASLHAQHARTVVAAPIAGTVVARTAQVGDFVGQQGGEPVLEIADFAALMVEVDVPEARLGGVKPGAAAEIVLDAFPGRRLRGTAREIVPRVNRAKAATVVKVAFDDPVDGVLPDMAARVGFLAAPLEATALREPPRLVVPHAALARRGDADVVFVMDGDRVRLTTVAVGAELGGGRVVERGPPEGTRLVVDPPAHLSDGQRVKEKLK
jgi:RND family efflux transporter MFP subunit